MADTAPNFDHPQDQSSQPLGQVFGAPQNPEEIRQSVKELDTKLDRLIATHIHNGSQSPRINANTDILGALSSIKASGSTALTGDVILAAGSNVTLTQSSQTITIAATSVTGLFGDGSDGAGVADGSTALAGASRSSSTYTLTRDVYYTNLTISTGVIIVPAGYQIFVSGTLTINGTGKIAYNGNTGSAGTAGGSGGAGTAGVGGTGGSALASGSLPGGVAGTTGGNGGGGHVTGNGTAGVAGGNGTSTTASIGVTGLIGATNSGGTSGAAGGFTGAAGGAGGSAGTATAALNLPHSLNGAYIHADLVATYIQHQGSASTGGAGGGAGGAGNSGDGGGGGGAGGTGSTGGIIAVYAKTIVNNASPGIQATGGAGGAGGNGANAAGGGQGGGGGGGAGGGGGTGGVLIVVYQTLTQSGTFDVTGGAGGNGGSLGVHAGGAGAADGGAGTTGGQGTTGKIWQYQIA